MAEHDSLSGDRHIRNRRLLDALEALDRATTLTEVLDTLARSVEREVPRMALLLVREGVLSGWRFHGFMPELDSTFESPVAGTGVIEHAIQSRTSALEHGASAPPFAQPIPSSSTTLAVPLLVAGAPVAVLYVDRTDDAAGADDEWALVPEVLARHAARCLEAITAFKTAAFAARGQSPQLGARAAADPDAEQSARRYARLLISEIKLYHEAEIAEGRRERDIAARLGGEIARAKSLYDARIPESIRNGTDFFRAELVRTLAEGDASLLGPPHAARSSEHSARSTEQHVARST